MAKPKSKKKAAAQTGMKARGRALSQPLKRSEPATSAAVESTNAAIVAAKATLVQPLGPDQKFFDGRDDRLELLTAPAVYREASGSHTTILLFIGRTKVRHVPMDAGGLRVVSTNAKRFRHEWVGTPYPVRLAADRYLKHASIAARARAGLVAVSEGDDMAAVKRALDRPLPEDAAPPGNGLAETITGAARAAKKRSVEATEGAARSGLTKGRGIGAWVRTQLLAEVPDDKILRDVMKKFPGAKTNGAHLNWYRNKMKRDSAD